MTVKTYTKDSVSPMQCYVAFSDYEELQRQLTAYEATVANLTATVQGLAAENAQMLRLLTDISENHGEFVNEDDDYMYASVPLDYVSEINMYVSRDVNAENPFEHTDAALAEMRIKAQLELCESLIELFKSCSEPGKPFAAGAAGALGIIEMKAEQLRKEQGK